MKHVLVHFFFTAACAAAAAQSSSSNLPEAPQPHSVPVAAQQPASNDSYFARAGVFCGTGASYAPTAAKPTIGCGAGMSLVPLPLFFEFGVIGPQAANSELSGYLSLDGSISLARSSPRYMPFAIVGYSRFFEVGHALDYGLALALPRSKNPKDDERSVRIELRDYCTFANPTQHNVMLRIGQMSAVYD